MSEEAHENGMQGAYRPNLLRAFMLGFLFLTVFASAVAAIAGFSLSAFAYPVWIAITAVGTLALSLLMMAAVLSLTDKQMMGAGAAPAPRPAPQPADDGGAAADEAEEEEDDEEEEEVGGQPFDAPTPSGRNAESPDAGAPTPSGRTPPGVDPDDLAGYTGDDGMEHVPDEEEDGGEDDVPTPSGN